jgi:hypothetical protein
MEALTITKLTRVLNSAPDEPTAISQLQAV